MPNALSPLFVGFGFEVTDLFLATGGVLRMRPLFEVGETAPAGASTARDVAGARFGVDLVFSPSDFVVLANGDLALTTGFQAHRAAFLRELLTRPGELFWRPTYGIGILELLNLPVTARLIADLQTRIRTSLESKPDVDEVLEVSVTVNDPDVDRMDVLVRYTLRAEPIALGFRFARAA